MKYTIVTEKRVNAEGMRMVYLNFSHFGHRFKVATGINTHGEVTAATFPKSDKDWRLKTAKLTRIISEVDKYLAFHDKEPYRAQKHALQMIIKGGDASARTLTLQNALPEFIKLKKKPSTAAVYTDTLRVVEDYERNTAIEDVDERWLTEFEDWLRERGHNTNGVGKHMRNLRALFNWLLSEERTTTYPFRRYKIKAEVGKPTTLTIEQLATIRDLPLPRHMERYRDFFMLSFYLCGMNIVDLLHVKHLTNGRMVFVRQKTGKHMSLPVCSEAAAIIERYKGKGQLLSPLDNMEDYHAFTKAANKALKKLGMVEYVSRPPRSGVNTIYHPLYPWMTMYTARYSFATIAASLGIPRETIALCLGHSWADVTAHYIAYDLHEIDEAVEKVTAALRQVSGRWLDTKEG